MDVVIRAVVLRCGFQLFPVDVESRLAFVSAVVGTCVAERCRLTQSAPR
jgi:hypothetical protein